MRNISFALTTDQQSIEKFLSKCKQRIGTPKTAKRSTCEAKQKCSSAAVTQPTLFDKPPTLSAEEIAYQKLLNELGEEDRNLLLQLTGGEWMQLDESFLGGDL